MTTRVLGIPTLSESQSGKFRTVNGALYFMDAVLGSVISRTNGAPPGSPSEGDAYIVDSATGDWSGFAVNDIVVYYQDGSGAAAWINVSPPTGPSIYVDNEDARVQFDGTDWNLVGAAINAIDVATSISLALSNNNDFISITAAATITVPANATVQFPRGSSITIFRKTASAVTITPAGGVTINGSVALSSQYDSVTLVNTGADEWAAL